MISHINSFLNILKRIKIEKTVKMYGLLSQDRIAIEEMEFQFLINCIRSTKSSTQRRKILKKDPTLLLFKNISKSHCFIKEGSLI